MQLSQKSRLIAAMMIVGSGLLLHQAAHGHISFDSISPDVTNLYTLGTSTKKWRDIWLSRNALVSTMTIGGGSITDSTGAISFGDENLTTTGVGTFGTLQINGLTATRIVQTDASKQLASVSDLTSWIAGVANETNVADDGDGTITIGLIDPLIAAKGGTGLATLTDHGILLGSGTGALTPLGAASNGQIPIGSTAADPVLATITGTSNQVTVTNGAGSITLSAPQDLHTGASPTFTGLTLSGDTFIIATDKTPTSTSADGTKGQIAWDTSYIYVCTATNSWERVAIASWAVTDILLLDGGVDKLLLDDGSSFLLIR